MITSTAFRGKRYAVLGLARSGLATVTALLASGAEVVAWDGNEAARDACPDGATLADPLTIDLKSFDGVIVSPGVPINIHPVADAARAANVPLIGDIELFAQARASLPPHKVAGITGTNGKSTTTALIYHILQKAGVPSLMGGNIGLPILGRDPLPAGGVYVLELSSYQIDLTYSLDCDIAVLLNITPDHLDRYDGFEGYAASKARLFEMQSAGNVTVRGETPSLDQTRWPTLQGPHNAQNAAAAMAVCAALGLDASTIELGLATYPGLPHRMERVRTLNDVLFVNDSKATNAESAAPALAAYPAIHWILGGVAKTKELEVCKPHFDHVRAAYTIGEAGPMFADLLSPYMSVSACGTMEVAVNSAAKAAKRGETILLSPACASFDQFRDFEARGDAFRAAVEALV